MGRKKKDEIKIDYGNHAFFSDSITITFNRSKFIFDFKQTIPRIDTIDNKGKRTLVTHHNVIIVDAGFAKVFSKTLNKVVENYDKKFGIKKIKAQEKDESYIG